MDLRELSARSGVPVATIKYYLREGLLPIGPREGGSRSRYDDLHLRRLALIRLLVEAHGLSLAAVRRITVAIDAGDPGDARRALVPSIADEPDLPLEDVDRFLDGLPGRVPRDGPERILLARALRDLRCVRGDVDADVFRPHARAAGWLVDEESGVVREDPSDAVASAAAFDAALTALRSFARVGGRP